MNENEENERTISNGHISINGRKEKQSNILINLLIDFIFPDSEEMNKEKFTHELGNVIISGIEILGDFDFAGGLGTSKTQSGVLVNASSTTNVENNGQQNAA